jgi:hypothetical protein
MFPNQTPVYDSLLTHTVYKPRPSHSSRFYHPKNTGEQYRPFSYPVTPSLSAPNIPLRTPFSNTLSIRSSLKVSNQVSHPHKITRRISVSAHV